MIFFSKLKSPWEDVEKEMVDEKGLSKEAADKIGVYVKQKGNKYDRNIDFPYLSLHNEIFIEQIYVGSMLLPDVWRFFAIIICVCFKIT